ncbi:hypothetical protein THAOC_25688 [Thalassiosira oceanica]|uniref:Uncharacterized protein n=1 Tax=Thalassiosira oceanica TaxID=159749 RepID=K0RLT4_THAOC|nr:hypothetical protein THAOC_25688 [Thalassiosira oceanica]|eukprot:EJK54663.1 hypothetical protein THAOC_25688 [Thalassiosira oceanica]
MSRIPSWEAKITANRSLVRAHLDKLKELRMEMARTDAEIARPPQEEAPHAAMGSFKPGRQRDVAMMAEEDIFAGASADSSPVDFHHSTQAATEPRCNSLEAVVEPDLEVEQGLETSSQSLFNEVDLASPAMSSALYSGWTTAQRGMASRLPVHLLRWP